MKKIYNYLFPVFLSLFAVAACDEDNEEIVQMTYENPCAIVTGISPVRGYVDTEFTISGEDFGVRTDDVKVYIGSQEASVVSCEDKAIVAKVPASATDGKITVEVFGQRVETDLSYSVLGKPGISAVKPSYGFTGTEILFEGHDLGVSKTLYTLFFVGCTEKTEIVGTPTDESFQLKVPESAESGIMTLQISNQTVDLASYPFTVLKHATLDLPKQGDPIPSGYAGSSFTITGTDLVQELLKPVEGLQPLRVTFTAKTGGEPIQAVIDGDKLTNKSITVIVPETLIAGDYVITVITPFETIKSTLAFTVLPMPEVVGATPLRGYVGSTMTIVGKNFVSDVKDIEVRFGDTPATEVTLEGENSDIVVKVPAMTDFGEKKLSLFMYGVEIPMGEWSTFELLTSPVIASVYTNNRFSQAAVEQGNTITITGTGFQNSSITSAMFNGQPLKVTVESNTQITATVPADCNVGEGVITLHFDGVDADIVSTDKLNMLKAGSDISVYVLTNGKQPFKAVEEFTGKGHYTPVGWKFNYGDGNNGFQHIGEGMNPHEGLFLGSSDDPGLLVIQNSWDKLPHKQNGKMWQTVELPAGIYDVVLNLTEVNVSEGGRHQAGFFIQKGDDTVLPDLNPDRYQWEGTVGAILADVNIATGNYNNQQLVMDGIEMDGQVTMGFVVQFNQKAHCLKLSFIEIRLK
ncbi:IPT/TIG domain-containing protein [Bacteroides acidifaciens]|uniref:IPT/TIG domain-containing protein n=1 Tax=Bacteroides acidifaciens TaxID=85831 RepID=UPI0023CB1271|nr:IPT/TIG domain-containing protein [Bacteroides acidifaciens]MDE6822421.1 IPT/TIG domain-containing protein [Bacteroides acidifaciens]